MLTAFIIDLHINIIICLSIQLTNVNLFASPNFKYCIVHLCTLIFGVIFYGDTSFDAHGVKKYKVDTYYIILNLIISILTL